MVWSADNPDMSYAFLNDLVKRQAFLHQLMPAFLLYNIYGLFCNQMALGINIHQTLIPLIMMANNFFCFFSSLKSVGWLVNEVESKGIKTGLSAVKS